MWEEGSEAMCGHVGRWKVAMCGHVGRRKCGNVWPCGKMEMWQCVAIVAMGRPTENGDENIDDGR